MKTYILKDRKLSIISKLSIVFLWVVLSRIVNNEVIIPSISSTFISMIEIIKGINFPNIIKYTLLRTLIGFSISLLLAMIMGIASSYSKIVYNFMDPISKFLNSVPTIALIVLALIWLNNELVPIFIGFIMVFPLLYETVLSSILNVNKEIIQYFSNHYPTDYPEVDVLIRLYKKGFRVIEMPVEMQQRKTGKSSITPLRSIYYIVKVTISLLIGSLKIIDE